MSKITVSHSKLTESQICGYANYVAALAAQGCATDKGRLLGYVGLMVYTAIVDELSGDDPDSRVVDDCHAYYDRGDKIHA